MTEITVGRMEQQPVLRAHAIRSTQGGRTVYHLSLRMSQFDDVLPEEVDENLIRDNNRRFIRSHAVGIGEYLQGTDRWVFGPITLSVSGDDIVFNPYDGQGESDGPVVGELRVLEGGRGSLKILDGQHRRRAIRDFRLAQLENGAAERQTRFEESQMPIALYVEDDGKAIRQMFADMANQRPMDAITTARFDTRDPFNRAANEVMLQSDWLGLYVEMDRSSVVRTSSKLISFNQLARNLKTLRVGYGGRISQIRMREAENEFDALVDLGVSWVDEFLVAARPEYAELASGDIDEKYLPKQRTKTLAYNGTILRILAGAHYEWRNRFPNQDCQALAEYVESLNFKPGLKTSDLVKFGVLEPGGVTPLSRSQEVRGAIKRIVDAAAAACLNAEKMA